jgi:small-conductance mechanosensitive channel
MESTLKRATRNRLIRAVFATIFAVWGMVLASFGQLQADTRDGRVVNEATPTEVVVFFAGLGLTLLAGIVAVRFFSRALRLALRDQVGDARSAPAGFFVSVVGYVLVTFAALSLLEVELTGLLLGGAVTGVVIGIAAQQTLGNFFAGIVLLMVRPFSVGDRVVLRSGPLGGEYEGTVTEMSLYYVHLVTDKGPVALPNAGVLASAVGPGARAKEEGDEEAPEDDPGPSQGGTA